MHRAFFLPKLVMSFRKIHFHSLKKGVFRNCRFPLLCTSRDTKLLFTLKNGFMAQTKDNLVVDGMSGKLGKHLVFRNIGGDTFVAKAPRVTEKEPTSAQLAHQDRFQKAVLYGQSVVADPQLKKEYQAAAKPRQSAFNVATADFMHAPDILEIDISEYNGQPGQHIKFKVTDDFKVKMATVLIQNPDGSVVEEGSAIQIANTADWVYTTRTTNTTVLGDKITITATDNPANVTTQGQIIQ
jgi:hypothetical protein